METETAVGTRPARIALLAMVGLAVAGVVLTAAGHSDAARVLALAELDVLWIVLLATGVILHRHRVPLFVGWRRIAASLPPGPVRRAIVSELGLLTALIRAVAQRPPHVPLNAIPITSTQGTLPIPIAIAIVTVLEVAALHIIIPWRPVSIALTLASVYSLILFFGYLAERRQHPHYLTATSLVLRNGAHTIATVPLDNIDAVTLIQDGSVTYPAVEGKIARIATMEGCSISVSLRSPQLLALTARHRASEYAVSEIRFAADDARETCARLLDRR